MRITDLFETERSLKNLQFNHGWDNMGNFHCNQWNLTSLEGAPSKTPLGEMINTFDCTDNYLKTLEGAPEKVYSFNCNGKTLTSLKGGPKIVEIFSCSNAAISTLEGIPQDMSNCYINDCSNITSLHNIHKYFGNIQSLSFRDCPIKSNVLGLLKIKSLNFVTLGKEKEQSKASRIIYNHLKSGRDIVECQQELIEAGLEDYAQL